MSRKEFLFSQSQREYLQFLSNIIAEYIELGYIIVNTHLGIDACCSIKFPNINSTGGDKTTLTQPISNLNVGELFSPNILAGRFNKNKKDKDKIRVGAVVARNGNLRKKLQTIIEKDPELAFIYDPENGDKYNSAILILILLFIRNGFSLRDEINYKV